MTVELPKDAKGREIPLDTECLYTCNGEKQDVLNKRALQRYLIDHDLTQDDFAKTLGISTLYLSQLLDGRKGISSNILFSIAEETAMDIHELVMEVNE